MNQPPVAAVEPLDAQRRAVCLVGAQERADLQERVHVVEAHAEAAEHGSHAEIVRRQALGHFEGEAGEGVRFDDGRSLPRYERDELSRILAGA